jgi:hypothetical protein
MERDFIVNDDKMLMDLIFFTYQWYLYNLDMVV